MEKGTADESLWQSEPFTPKTPRPGRECGCCNSECRKPDFGRPSRYEACVVTQASLYVAFLFWAIAFAATFSGDSTTSITENGDSARLARDGLATACGLTTGGRHTYTYR